MITTPFSRIEFVDIYIGKHSETHQHSKIVNTLITPKSLPLLLWNSSVLLLLRGEALERCAYLGEAGWGFVKLIVWDRDIVNLWDSSLSHVLFQLVHVVPDRFPLGPDGVGVLWKLPIITAPLGVCVLLIYIWRTILAVSILK